MALPDPAVARWVPVTHRWLGYRPEPFIHERLWACPLVGETDDPTFPSEAGFDVEGRAVAMRCTPPGESPRIDFVTTYSPGDIRVTSVLEPDRTVRTTLDQRGRPIATSYGRDGAERYEYDEAGQLVRIAECDVLWFTGAIAGERSWAGGDLTVEHDDVGAVRITGGGDDGGVVWERVDEPWEETLATGAETYAAGLVRSIARECREHGVPRSTEVFALSLIYVNQGSLHVQVEIGVEEERRVLLASETDPFEIACSLWYLHSGAHPLAQFEDDELPSALDALLLREAALKQPGDPYRAVLTEVARRLARRDWSELFATTADFVVFIAEHDEGFGPKHASVREVNPPERVAAWDASWPTGADRDD